MSRLKKLREQKQLSQGQLAIKSKVPIRTIKAYEQRKRDINKAQAHVLYKLAKTLGCTMEDLIEDDAVTRIK